MLDDALPPFEAHGGILEPFEDGHIPETFRCTDNDNDDDENNVPRIVRYPLHHAESPSVHVYDDALPTGLLDQLYRCTTVNPEDANPRPWGTYVTIQEAVEWMDNRCDGDAVDFNIQCESPTMEEHRHDLAVAVIPVSVVSSSSASSKISWTPSVASSPASSLYPTESS